MRSMPPQHRKSMATRGWCEWKTSLGVSAIAFANQLAHRIQSEVLPNPAELLNHPAQGLLRLSERALAGIVDLALESWRQISGLTPR